VLLADRILDLGYYLDGKETRFGSFQFASKTCHAGWRADQLSSLMISAEISR